MPAVGDAVERTLGTDVVRRTAVGVPVAGNGTEAVIVRLPEKGRVIGGSPGGHGTIGRQRRQPVVIGERCGKPARRY